MTTGHPQLVVPTSTSEYHAMVNSLRAHHRAMHGQASDVAAALKTILPDVIRQRGGARTGLMGADAKLKTNRIIRPIMEIAALNDTIARLYVLSYNRYVDLVVNAKTTAPGRFNVDG